MSRSNNESLLYIALTSRWTVSAGFATFFLILGYVILPLFARTRPILVPIAQGFQPILALVAGLFAVIAFLVWLWERLKKANNQHSVSFPRRMNDERVEPRNVSLPVSGTFSKPSNWSLELLQSIEWKRFEDLCQKFYEVKGIRSECTALGPDGGIDIRLFQEGFDRATAIVQCKAWGGSFVGVKPIRELLGVMVHEKVQKAFFMTTGKYSDDAKNFAAQHPITLIDGSMFLVMLSRLPEQARNSLLAFATEGEYNIPSCPRCGTKMRLIEGKEGKPDFWGCVNFPKCRQKLWARRDAGNLVTAVYQ
jgi:restriction system protein